MVECASEIVNDIPGDNGNIGRSRLSIFDEKRRSVLQHLVILGANLVRVSSQESSDGNAQVGDVFVSPFNFGVDSFNASHRGNLALLPTWCKGILTFAISIWLRNVDIHFDPISFRKRSQKRARTPPVTLASFIVCPGRNRGLISRNVTSS